LTFIEAVEAIRVGGCGHSHMPTDGHDKARPNDGLRNSRTDSDDPLQLSGGRMTVHFRRTMLAIGALIWP